MKETGPPPTGTKTLPPLTKLPTHQTTHPPTDPSTHQRPQPCATAAQQHVQQQTDAFGQYSIFRLKLVWGVGKSLRDVRKIVRTIQLDAAVHKGTGKPFFDDFPAFLVISIFYLEVGVKVAISLDFDSFSVLTQVLHQLLYLLSRLRGLGWGFHTAWGGISPGDFRSRPPVVGVADAWKDFRTSDGALLPMLRWLYVGAPTNQRSASGVRVSTPCGAVSIRENNRL